MNSNIQMRGNNQRNEYKKKNLSNFSIMHHKNSNLAPALVRFFSRKKSRRILGKFNTRG